MIRISTPYLLEKLSVPEYITKTDQYETAILELDEFTNLWFQKYKDLLQLKHPSIYD